VAVDAEWRLERRDVLIDCYGKLISKYKKIVVFIIIKYIINKNIVFLREQIFTQQDSNNTSGGW
jgi:hypothetical protein